MEIYKEILYVFLTILLTAFFASIIPRKLKDRERFMLDAAEYKKSLNRVRVEAERGEHSFGVPIDAAVIKAQQVAHLSFCDHLRGECRKQYDKAWDKYCHDFEDIRHLGKFPRATRVDLEQDIKRLLEFTDYKLLGKPILLWRKYFVKPEPLTTKQEEIIRKLSEELGLKDNDPPKE